MRLITLFTLFTLTTLSAQVNPGQWKEGGTVLPFPRNFEMAYEKGYRQQNGAPGPNYWQNRADYNIEVELEPKKHLVKGSETVTYFNNSPDSLRMIRIKLQHDLYKKGGLRASDIEPEDVTDGVNIERILINGAAPAKERQRRAETFLEIKLEKPMAPKTSLQMVVDWSFTMPQAEDATRECVCDPGTFFIPYFYPQVAVYDDRHGWASAPYNGLQEFYHDFANYNVGVTVPKGYMVWATGEWQNAADLLTETYFKRWDNAHKSDQVVQIFSEAEIKQGDVFKKAKKQRFHYRASDVPDFTFATSNHYNWDASSVVVDDKTGRKTFVGAAYNTTSNDFKRVASIAAQGVRLMSTWMPGYPFPYPCLTVFNGNDGMEYPMMINDASVGDDNVVGLTVHESAHTYFPFMMGVNEQYYAWMDEGWANFFDHHLADSIEHKSSGVWAGGFGQDWEVPPMVPSRSLDGRSYGFASYSRPQMAYHQLYDILGYETFHQCMTTYMDRWKGKHPGPYDFFNTWNDVSGKDLNWFWKPWFFEFGYPDLAIQSVSRKNDDAAANWVVMVEKKGLIPVGVVVTAEFEDGTKEAVRRSAEVWAGGKTVLQVPIASSKRIKSVTLGSKMTPDVRKGNDKWPAGK